MSFKVNTMRITDFSMDYFSLKGKNAIVTGGNTGLGQAFALALAKAGANIFIPSITEDGDSTRERVDRGRGCPGQFTEDGHYGERGARRDNRCLL